MKMSWDIPLFITEELERQEENIQRLAFRVHGGHVVAHMFLKFDFCQFKSLYRWDNLTCAL